MRLAAGLVISMLLWSPAFSTQANSYPERAIVLTFDDGPVPKVLEKLLPLLEKYDVPATFFIIGGEAEGKSALLKQMYDAGHEIENHSLGHENFKKLFAKEGAEGIEKNLKEAADIIFKATGRYPTFFRPPYWEITQEVENIITAKGYHVVKLERPDVNTLDYEDVSKGRPASVLIERVKKLVDREERHGNYTPILVFHERLLTVEALEVLIPYFQEQGYVFLRLDEVMQQ